MIMGRHAQWVVVSLVLWMAIAATGAKAQGDDSDPQDSKPGFFASWGSAIADGASSLWNSVKDEAKLDWETVQELPEAYVKTAESGEQIDNLANTVDRVGDAIHDIPQDIPKVVDTVKDESGLALRTLEELPNAYVQTAIDGRQADSFSGFLKGATFAPTTPIYGHQTEFDGGQTIGRETLKQEAVTLLTAGVGAAGETVMGGISEARAATTAAGELDGPGIELLDVGSRADAAPVPATPILARPEPIPATPLLAQPEPIPATPLASLGQDGVAAGQAARGPGDGLSFEQALANAQRDGTCVVGACFVAGTKVWTPRGLEAIESIAPDAGASGAVVLARDPSAGPALEHRVLRSFRRTVNHLRVLMIGTPGEAAQEIRTTDAHPFFVSGRGWVRAGDLSIGDPLVTACGGAASVLASVREAHPEGVRVFNFEVEGVHTYMVGTQGILVHNDCDPWSMAQPGKPLVLEMPTREDAMKAATDLAGMTGGSTEPAVAVSDEQLLKPGSRGPKGPIPTAQTWLNMDNGATVNYHEFGHRFPDGGTIDPHFGVHVPGKPEVHFTWSDNDWDPRNNIW